MANLKHKWLTIGGVEIDPACERVLLAIGKGKDTMTKQYQANGYILRKPAIEGAIDHLEQYGALKHNAKGFELTTKGQKVLNTLKDLKGKK